LKRAPDESTVANALDVVASSTPSDHLPTRPESLPAPAIVA
jgi:hypothetical protein